MDLISREVVEKKRDFLFDCGYNLFGTNKPKAEDAGKTVWVAALERGTQKIVVFFGAICPRVDGSAWIEVNYQGEEPDHFLLVGWRERNGAV